MSKRSVKKAKLQGNGKTFSQLCHLGQFKNATRLDIVEPEEVEVVEEHQHVHGENCNHNH